MNLLIRPVRDRVRGGGQRYFQFLPLCLKKRLKRYAATIARHLGPFWDHFGADTGRSSQNFGFRKQIAAVSAPNRFRNRSGCIFRLGTRIDRFPKLSHNQHPAGSHSKSRAGLFASSKKHAGRKNPENKEKSGRNFRISGKSSDFRISGSGNKFPDTKGMWCIEPPDP